MSRNRIRTLQDVFLPENRIETQFGCWEWQGKKINGYGVFTRNKKEVLVHRSVLEALTGSLGKLFALHKCDNPSCFRPDHLFRGTQADNLADMTAKGRRRNGTGWIGKSGVFGVVWVKRRNKWRVRRREGAKVVSYGDFSDLSRALELNDSIRKARGEA